MVLKPEKAVEKKSNYFAIFSSDIFQLGSKDIFEFMNYMYDLV